ncbi:GlcNAc-PI de-N-acetylase [Gordonia sp. SID5947]|uniref:PIG-L family deacetylase n=1 Tax=Gordonia sp. SID5947 TaxID=2690315 RepID=UPI00136AFDDA|nr:PIG-L family deacetylase [Gordonia sp. SID5947]MYR05423.1 GlcNAc-PI de-N-acetylase [Gordonia sp. SID5947]
MAPPRLLFVHAHPDDESLWTGGAIARHTSRGGDADLVVCTWAAGTGRHTELVEAARTLGLPRPPIMLGYADDRVPDSAPDSVRFCSAPLDAQVRTLVEHIRRLRPDAVVTYDAIGVYGHPDHVHAHRLATVAADAAASGGLYRSAGEAWRVRSMYFVTIAQWMVDDVQHDLFADLPPKYLPGTPEDDVDLVLDVSQWRDRKADAIFCHRTELDRSRTMKALMSLPPERRSRLLGTECFLRRDLVPGGVDLE